MAGGDLGNAMQVKLRGNILRFPVKIATAIYRGTPVAIDAAGYLIQMGDGAAMKMVGIAEEGCTAAEAVADGTMNLKIRRHGIFRMTKQTTSAATDVGKVVYGHTTHSASVDGLCGLAASCTYDNALGLVVRREPDTPGGSAYTNNWLMVDITPAPWSATDVTTHAALADQTAHTAAGIAPTVATESSATPTITAAEFFGGLIACTYAGGVAFTLPTSGVTAGTQCRVVKANATAGALAITGGTLTGQQCLSNVFTGCMNEGDSVVVMCVSANVYRIVSISSAQHQIIEAATNPTTTAAEFMEGIVNCGYDGAVTIVLPASGVLVGSKCTFVKEGTAGLFAMSATTLVGTQCASNAFVGCGNPGDSVTVMCLAADSYIVTNVNQAIVSTDYSGDDPTVTALAFMGGEVELSQAGATTTATTLPSSGVAVGARCQFRKTGSAGDVKITATAFVGAGTASNVSDEIDADEDVCDIECVGADSYRMLMMNVA